MTRFSTAVLAFTFAVASAPGLTAQTATVFEVNYEVVGIDADGNAERQGEGVHYIAPDGRQRHDRLVRGEQTSFYNLPHEDATIAVNHAMRTAVRTPIDVTPWNPSVRERWLIPPQDSGTRWLAQRPTMLGERTHGPVLLRGFTQHTGDVSIESWWHFTSLSAVDPIKYSPVLMEATFTIGATGYRHVTKITSARAIPLSADIFMIPYPEY